MITAPNTQSASWGQDPALVSKPQRVYPAKGPRLLAQTPPVVLDEEAGEAQP